MKDYHNLTEAIKSIPKILRDTIKVIRLNSFPDEYRCEVVFGIMISGYIQPAHDLSIEHT
jgi:hypothetical protein